MIRRPPRSTLFAYTTLYQFSPDNVDAPDVIEIHTPPIANLLEHQLLVVEALGAQERYGQGEGLDPRGSPRPRPRLHSLYPLDLARRPNHGHPGVRRQIVPLEVHVPQSERLVVEAPGALAYLFRGSRQKRLTLPRLRRALPRHERPVYLPSLEQRDE